MDGDRDPDMRETTRGAGAGALVLMCTALVAAVVIAGYVLVTALFQGLR